MKNKVILFIGFLLFFSSEIFSQNDGFIDLFNGKDLSGWTQLNGQAKFEALNGEIVGTTAVNSPNSFLCTNEKFSDFVLEMDLWVEKDMNSGIQFRSESNPEFENGRVFGYQCEIDPSERAWSGGIYDEARRGWLYPLDLNPGAKTAFKNGEWNHYKIECIGNSIKTWVNGIACAQIFDDVTKKGFIALQVHSIGNDASKAGEKIHWKNIRIKTKNLKPLPYDGIYVENLLLNNLSEPEKEQGFELLFDGKSTANFRSANGNSFPEKGWEVKDGILTVLSNEGKPENKGGDIVTKKEFGAFELKFDFNFTKGANSGVKYCTGNNGPSIGLEYQILDDENHPDAKMGIDGNRTLASLYDLIAAKKEARFVNGPDNWNRGRIVVFPDGKVQHWLNGRKVVEYVRGSETYKALVAKSKYADYKDFGMVEKGPVLFQEHNDTVHFKNIKIREIK